jgi:hypothetical protein
LSTRGSNHSSENHPHRQQAGESLVGRPCASLLSFHDGYDIMIIFSLSFGHQETYQNIILLLCTVMGTINTISFTCSDFISAGNTATAKPFIQQYFNFEIKSNLQ